MQRNHFPRMTTMEIVNCHWDWTLQNVNIAGIHYDGQDQTDLSLFFLPFRRNLQWYASDTMLYKAGVIVISKARFPSSSPLKLGQGRIFGPSNAGEITIMRMNDGSLQSQLSDDVQYYYIINNYINPNYTSFSFLSKLSCCLQAIMLVPTHFTNIK
jgi:hypothetical protein